MGFGGDYVLNRGFHADGAITQFRLVKAGSDSRHVTPAAVAGERVLGVCQETISAADATSERVVNIAILGVSLVEAGGVVAAGARVKTDNVGRVVAAAEGVGNEEIVGVAFDAASAAGDWIAVLLTPGATFNAAVS